jgi:hypothetical protein
MPEASSPPAGADWLAWGAVASDIRQGMALSERLSGLIVGWGSRCACPRDRARRRRLRAARNH